MRRGLASARTPPRGGPGPDRTGGLGLLAAGNPGSRVAVGLGNAERRFTQTRHNVGAQAVLGALATMGLAPREGPVPIPLSRSGLVLPSGFMNESGHAVRRAVERWRPAAEGLLVVHDDLEVPLGAVEVKEGGGHGGHNGLRDVMAALGTGAFRRLRIGIGRPPGRMDPADYVLAPFAPDERDTVEAAVRQASDLVLQFIGWP